MDPMQRMQSLMMELGPAAGDIAAVVQSDAAAWAVVVDGDLIASAEFDPEQDKLLLSVELGTPEPARRSEIYDAALNYSFLWRDTGGAWIALGGTEGALYLMFDASASALDASSLSTLVRNIAAKAKLWREYLAGGDVPAGGQDDRPLGMRV